MPSLPWCQLLPPSSVSITPAAEMPSAIRCGVPGQGAIEWTESPPESGRQRLRDGCSQSAVLSSNVSPPSRLEKSTPGSPPAQIVVPSSVPTITQMRLSACVPPLGSTIPRDGVHSPARSSVYQTRGP